jgi:hypothetical protein
MSILPTWSIRSGAVTTRFRDALVRYLARDSSANQLNMYFYEVTRSGWKAVWPSIRKWQRKKSGRRAYMYCGLSNWLSDPEALEEMMRHLPGRVWVVQRSHGVFHPKAFIFRGSRTATCFIGSNNLTEAGLNSNFELGVQLEVRKTDNKGWRWLNDWETTVRGVATPLTQEILAIYREEYRHMTRLPRNSPGVVGKNRARLATAARSAGLPSPKVAVLEVMPRETGTGGSQLQIPKEIAMALFNLPPGGQRQVVLRDANTGVQTTLTLTDYGNNTRRLSIHRLTQVPRPRIIWFRRIDGVFEFDIVSRVSDPTEFDRLLALCPFQTTSRSKRWGMYEDEIL